METEFGAGCTFANLHENVLCSSQNKRAGKLNKHEWRVRHIGAKQKYMGKVTDRIAFRKSGLSEWKHSKAFLLSWSTEICKGWKTNPA